MADCTAQQVVVSYIGYVGIYLSLVVSVHTSSPVQGVDDVDGPCVRRDTICDG